MTGLLSQLPVFAGIFIGFASGLAVGLVHFASLRRVTTLYLSGGSAFRALALHLARFALLIPVLALMAQAGAAPLLACAAGVLAARTIVLHRLGKVT